MFYSILRNPIPTYTKQAAPGCLELHQAAPVTVQDAP